MRNAWSRSHKNAMQTGNGTKHKIDMACDLHYCFGMILCYFVSVAAPSSRSHEKKNRLQTNKWREKKQSKASGKTKNKIKSFIIFPSFFDAIETTFRPTGIFHSFRSFVSAKKKNWTELHFALQKTWMPTRFAQKRLPSNDEKITYVRQQIQTHTHTHASKRVWIELKCVWRRLAGVSSCYWSRAQFLVNATNENSFRCFVDGVCTTFRILIYRFEMWISIPFCFSFSLAVLSLSCR